MLNPEKTIAFQFGNSPTIGALIELFNESVDPTGDVNNIYSYVWNVLTAQGFGLDIWGAIVDIPRTIQGNNLEDSFGFNQDFEPFNQAPFYDATQGSVLYTLDDATYRMLILIKALSNISATNTPTINNIISKLFAGRGRCYSMDIGNMQMNYIFEFRLTAFERAILANANVLPHPAGVQVSFYEIPNGLFGFKTSGGYYKPFNQGVFYVNTVR